MAAVLVLKCMILLDWDVSLNDGCKTHSDWTTSPDGGYKTHSGWAAVAPTDASARQIGHVRLD